MSTASLETAGPDWVSLTAADLLVSMRVPRGWEATAPDRTTIAAAGPDGVSLSVQRGVPEEPGHDWFVEFARAVPAQLQDDVPGFELIETERFRLSSAYADVLLVAARRDDGLTGAVGPTAQVQAYVWAGDRRMYVVAGSTPAVHEARDLPVLRAVVHSLRLLPPRG
ncbi:hypothetical protein ABFT23_04575 [Nocardioides sp. C4-1]|uniref:hypothetical protein n=1 Tax=Nocardioides sp. C4-1 TaxID=3151851 RepID=UPI003264AAF1